MNLKIPALLCCLASPMAFAGITIYPHNPTGLVSVQVYEDGSKAVNANVEITTAKGRKLAASKTNRFGWAKLGRVEGDRVLTVKVETANGDTKDKTFYMIEGKRR